MIRKLPYIFIYSLFATACTHSDKANGPISLSEATKKYTGGYESNTPLPVCYVLCDFSASLTGSSRQLVIENAARVLRSCVPEYRVKYYDINAAQFTPPFFEYAVASGYLVKASDIKNKTTIINKAADSLQQVIKSLHKSPFPSGTCIIRTLDKIANALGVDDAARQGRTTRIIILSDMLEDCSYPFGRINIEKPPFNPAFNILKKMPKPVFNLEPYKGLEVTVVASSSHVIADVNFLFVFWKEVFGRYGFEFKGPITTNLPSWIK